MSTSYNRIAGQSLERLAALSDGIFAIAMTLLVLDLRIPVLEIAHSQQPIWESGALQSEQILVDALLKLSPRLLVYFMSFMTLGIFWLGQQTQLNHFACSDRNLAWNHLAFLLMVSVMPFSTGLLADFITYRLALVIYWLNLLLLGMMLLRSWRYAHRAGLMKEGVAEIQSAIERRIVIYQALYAFGALLCVINTYLSIAFIVLVQLNAALAPRIRLLNRF